MGISINGLTELNSSLTALAGALSDEGPVINKALRAGAVPIEEQMLANAKADIVFERNRMLDEVQREIVDATISATEKMLSERIDEKADKRIIDDFIKEITKK